MNFELLNDPELEIKDELERIYRYRYSNAKMKYILKNQMLLRDK